MCNKSSTATSCCTAKGLTQGLVPSRHAKISTVNINVQLSPSSDSGGHAASLKCNPFLHVAAFFSKDNKLRAEWTAAYLEVKLAATHLSPQQESNSLGFLGHDK